MVKPGEGPADAKTEHGLEAGPITSEETAKDVPDYQPVIPRPPADGPVAKVLILGDSGTGKTAILGRLQSDSYSEEILAPTLIADFKYKVATVGDMTLNLELWDSPGREEYWSMSKEFCIGAVGVFIVYDVTREETANHVGHWAMEAKACANRNAAIFVLGNKADLKTFRDRREVASVSKSFQTYIGAEEVKDRAGLTGNLQVDGCYEVSAKTGEGLDEALEHMLSVLAEKKPHSFLDDPIERAIEEAALEIERSRELQRQTNQKSCCTCL